MNENEKRCTYEFGPGVRCMMVAGHDLPYYPYLDYGQWGKYSDILSEGSRHQVLGEWPTLPPREDWTGQEPKDPDHPTYPVFAPKRPAEGVSA